jgi:cyanophycin synthetase
VRLVEVRLLDGPNVYRLEPAVKIEIALGRRRTWYGQRMPGRHSVVRLGAIVPARSAPPPLARMAAWVRRLQRVAHDTHRARPTIHRTGEPGVWVIAFPWRERERAEVIAQSAYRLTDRGSDPRRDEVPRSLERRIREAGTTPPEWITDAERRVPIVSISGTNGKSTTTRMIGHILSTAGGTVGSTTTDGVTIDGTLVEEGDYTGPLGSQAVLGRPGVDVAVLETARGGILLRGLGYESNDASVLTNVSSDHLDLQGLHTVPELAEVKSVICRVTRPDGAVVLNADDPLVAAVARRVKAPVTFFSLRPGSARVRRHLASGGRVMLLDDGWLIDAKGGSRRRIVPASDVPSTFGGIARHNIANALAAAGGALAMGASREQVAEGLRTFLPTPDQMPGRLNFYRLGRRLVIIDFAHNEAGLLVVMEMIEALIGRRGRRKATLTAIIGTGGDRPDDSLRALGRIAAEHADQVAIKQTYKYLRGRTPQSMVGELLAGVRAGARGTRRPREDVPSYEDEPGALHAELTTPGRLAADDEGPPRVVLLMCHADRPDVERVLRDLGAEPVIDTADLPDFRK